MFSLSNYFFNIHSVPSFTIGFLSLALGIFVITQKNRSSVNFSFFLVAISVSIWLLATGMGTSSLNENNAAAWFKIDNFGVLLISVSIYLFTRLVLDLKTNAINYLGYILAITLGFIEINTNWLVVGVRKFYWGFFPKWEFFSIPVFFVFFSFMFLSYYTLAVEFLKHHPSPTRTNKIRYLVIGYVIGYMGSVDFMSTFGLNIYPFGCFFTFIFLLIIAYASARYQLLDIRIVITRAGIFMAVYTLVLGAPFAIGWFIQDPFEILHVRHWWLIPTTLMFLLASLGPIIFSRLRRQAEETLLKEQRRYQHTLLNASQGMTLYKELDKLLNLIVHVLTKTIRITYAAIYLYDKNTTDYILKARRGVVPHLPLLLSTNDPLLKFIREQKKAVTPESIEALQNNSDQNNASIMRRQINDLKISVIVPSIMQEELVGFLILGDKLSKQPYTEDDLNVFVTLANNSALAIENAMFYETQNQTLAEKFHEHRMWSLGRMGSGIGHQINNRFNVVTVKLDTMRLLEVDKLKNTVLSAEQKELVDTIEKTLISARDEALRGGEIATALTQFSRKTTDYKEVQLEDAIKGATNVLSCKFNLIELNLSLDFPQKGPAIFGNLSQLQDVFMNLLDNAHDALLKKEEEVEAGNIKTKTAFEAYLKITGKTEGNYWHIQLKDNGIGMKEDELKQLFIPFFTTKATSNKGTGLGLSIIKQIIEAHHGSVEIKSVYGEGTVFTIKLPIYKKPAQK